jgi:hydrogenase maturation factor HypE
MHCARLLAAEQREALKVLRAQAKVKATSEDPVNYDHEDVLDIVEPLVAEMVDQAEADRFRQSVDDLM